MDFFRQVIPFHEEHPKLKRALKCLVDLLKGLRNDKINAIISRVVGFVAVKVCFLMSYSEKAVCHEGLEA